MACLALAVAEVTCAQSLEKIQWFNEPERWTAEDGILTMQVPPHCDYWRVSHYGFTVDDAPFCYAIYGGEFEAKVKVTGDYKTRFASMPRIILRRASNSLTENSTSVLS